MPIYEFKCLECQAEFEELCAIKTESIACPNCQSTQTKRKISLFSAKSTDADGIRSITKGNTCGSCHGGHCGTCH